MGRIIRIGTRDSELAMWQAKTVEQSLQKLGYKTELVPVKSTGDLVLDKPLYEMGITGIFTKTLDVAMIKKEVDIAVHSMKDVPTALPQGIVQGAVLKRANTVDILLHKGDTSFMSEEVEAVVATGSLRRKAQWLNRFPKHTTVDLRGNVNTRMEKLQNSDWNGAIFASAGLDRIKKKPSNFINLDWMIPAPAQGAMVVVVNADDNHALDAVAQLNDYETEMTTYIERQFLRTLEGGCTAPIGALATYNDHDDTINFKGVLFSLDGQQKFEVNKVVDIAEWKKLGFFAAKEILENGGSELMETLRQQLKK
ncbi:MULTISPECIES: hydroxymethylbilane synthase [Myroides]|uniref:Hydroxymethylbilane synthase n=4 Tax=Myroides TaxID=76831 RepID=A0A0S7EJA7_9FLAO|nr:MULTISPECIES: hydroxymethylbilane synthase [Myroides]AJA68121.1 hydroxymethylbilane synthase [Myroides sp. A21]AJH16587.1 hydroxymethylbilane synthase [Myroides profundi]ALU25431.1 porphobilinogen deaminase [Myroides odoratimimus]APA91446.1 hydroxymethylbilane synthase [Myroides sp. ZB35]EHO05627.1 porphobilinogen deaminase [Myroides odoratimimus CIP 101113]